ncbi:hypothetical protein MKEN_00414300 [Mycena kentingensis (nom. inval.)]|nr:hypothetical protein MKEN_00414300 [Mycena kentingensis (nom. inval.)]
MTDSSAPHALHASVAAIFEQAQTSLANHRKNCVALYKIHAGAGSRASSSKKPSAPADQTVFVATFIDMVARVLVVKKGPPTVERTLKFIAHYVRFINEKTQEDKAKAAENDPTQSISARSVEDEETLASVFVSALLEWIIQGFVAKNKVVRFQTVHLVAEMVMYLGEVDEETYTSLRENLIERATCDKESSIRAQAVSALSRLISSEDPNDVEEGEKSILEVVLEIVVYDPAPDVRRAALLHLPLTGATLPTILTRTRDDDPLLRKLVYSSVFQPHLEHPRLLSIAQREQLVQTGLGDREPAVRVAAAKLVYTWFELVLADPARADDALPWDGDDGGIMAALIAFLNLFDVVGPGEAIAVDAVLSLLTTRPDLFDVVTFSNDYWESLTPESTVLARTFLEHCLSESREERLESASLPVVTAFAFTLQAAYNRLLAVLEDAEVARALAGEDPENDMDDDAEEELAKREVIIGELLRMAVKLDYGDEIGRRKVYTVTRAMLAHPQLPPGLIARALDVMKEILPTERELIRVVVEIIVDLREPEDGDVFEGDTTAADTTHSTLPRERSLRRAKTRDDMTTEEAIRADMTDMRCLEVCISMLERVHGDFEDNSTLEGVLTDLVVPAVRRKEVGIREKGLVALGLCCLIAKGIAVKSLQLFLSQIQNAPEQLKLKLLQIVFDLMVMYDQQMWARVEDGQAILTFLANTLAAEESPVVQGVLCVGLAKLLLSGLADDLETLKALLITYVSPYTAGNAELRQCLSYFFSVYCYSSAENQGKIQAIFMSAFDEVTKMHDEHGLEEDQDQPPMVSPQQFGLLVIDWTDARKAADIVANGDYPQKPHAELASDILLALYDSDRRSEDQEVLCALLNNLHIAGALPAPVMVKLSVLVQHIQKQCPFDDAALDKAVSKFKNKVTAEYAAPLAEVDWEEWETTEMKELYDFIGIDVPDVRDARPEAPAAPAKSKKAKGKEKEKAPANGRGRSKSRAPVADAEDDVEEEDVDAEEQEQEQEEEEPEPKAEPKQKRKAPVKARGRGKSRAKSKPASDLPPKLNLSAAHTEEEEEPVEDNEEEENVTPPSPSPVAQPLPKAARGKAKARAPAAKRGRSVSAKQEPPEDAEDEPASRKSTRSTRTRSKPPNPEESEDELATHAPPKAKANGRAKAGKGKKAPVAETESADHEAISAQSKKPARAQRSRSKAEAEVDSAGPSKRTTRTSRSKVVPRPEEAAMEEDDAESERPATPPPRRTSGNKRERTPSSKVDLPSPAEKKKRKPTVAAAPTKGTRASSRRKASATVSAAPADSDDEFGGYGAA